MPSDSSWNTPLAFALLQQGVGLRVVGRQVLEVDLQAARLFDSLDAVVEQGQRAQPQEVHLEQADLFEIAHDPLGGDGRFAAPAAFLALAHRPVDRDVIGDRAVGDHHARRVNARLPVGPLQRLAMSTISWTSGSPS